MLRFEEVLLEQERETQIAFLERYNLDYEYDIDYAVLVYDDTQLIGTASLARNVMKCFLVDEKTQGMQVMTKMFEHLLEVLEEREIDHYFVYTMPHNEEIFEQLGMHVLVRTMNTVLLEGGRHIKDVLQDLKDKYFLDNRKKHCVIINGNPMTLGHLYLIEEAARNTEQLLVFVVSEDASSFPFHDRFEIIKKATEHLENVVVLPTMNYLVSKITFPKYFLKEDQLIDAEQTLIDVLIYKEYFVKFFNIKKRYLGEEPFSYNTNKYNQVLKQYMNGHIEIIPRKAIGENIISASKVRKLLKANKLDKVKDYVPKATFEFLQSKKGQSVINHLIEHTLERH
ncbi:MAG: [citrate (pro-3S)-lyase] ligase [Candidatus Izemoplasmataceae bacterium]